MGQTAKILAERTEFSDINTNEGHGRDPDGVSLDVSDDDYREENTDNEIFSEEGDSSQDEGDVSEAEGGQEESEDERPVQSSSESEDEASSSSSSSSEEEEPEFENKRSERNLRRTRTIKLS